jgi:drug/metabolite transporter (DMT)-like permease
MKKGLPSAGLRRGALGIFLAAILFGVLGAVVKRISEEIPSAMVVFFRNALGLVALVPFLVRGGWKSLATRDWPGHLTRSFAGVGAMYLSFYAISRMRLADAYVLAYAAPLYMPFIARIWLKEPIPRHAGAVLLLGFAGVALMLKPGWGVFQPVALIALASGVLAAVAQVGTRQLTRTEPPVRIVFYFGALSTVLTAPPLAGIWTSPSPAMWAALAGLGVVATAAQIFMTEGYKHGPPARVGPIMYVAVATAGILDWIFWRRVPDGLSLLGAGLIVAACVWIVRETAAAPPAGEEPSPS